MALAAMAMYADPEHLVKIRKEFDQSMGGKPYVPPIPADVDPPRFNPEGN
jgi:aminobenzoyl-glutamate utilization protein B